MPWLREAALLAAGLAVLALASWGLVALLTPPASQPAAGWEVPLKNLLKDQLELALNASVVDRPLTRQALDVLRARLESALPQPLPYRLDLVVVSSPQINAYTLPGGLIVVNQGLLEQADAEETAAVLAHEIGHVFHHDPADALGRSVLLASVLALTTSGDVAAQVIQELTQNAFGRQVEDRADAFACDLLARARLRPSHLADFLASLPEPPLGKMLGPAQEHLQDHPTQEARIAKARKAPFAGTEEAFDLDWKAVQAELRER